jgi:hypothetical protein
MRLTCRSLYAEILKLKRSLALWLAALAPLVVVIIQFFLVLQRGDRLLTGTEDPWLWLGRQTMIFWSFLMLPLFITLETGLVAGLEHAGDNWKHLFALPVPRTSFYVAKLSSGLVLVGLSQLMLSTYIVLAGVLLKALNPGLEFGAVPVGDILRYAAVSYLSCWLLIVLHTYVALRWKNFVVAMGFGIVMTVAGFLILNSTYANYYPWALPGLILNKLKNGEPCLWQLLLGGPSALLAAALGGWDFLRRDVL